MAIADTAAEQNSVLTLVKETAMPLDRLSNGAVTAEQRPEFANTGTQHDALMQWVPLMVLASLEIGRAHV